MRKGTLGDTNTNNLARDNTPPFSRGVPTGADCPSRSTINANACLSLPSHPTFYLLADPPRAVAAVPCVLFGDRYGAKIFAKGDRHEGMYRDDKRNGWGKYVWANGDKYIGEWHQGMMHGRGTFSWQKVRACARGRPFHGVVVL